MCSHELTYLRTALGQVFRIGIRSPGVVVRTDVIWQESYGHGTLVVWMDNIPQAPPPKIEPPPAAAPGRTDPPRLS
jgi:hypothetical protein